MMNTLIQQIKNGELLQEELAEALIHHQAAIRLRQGVDSVHNIKTPQNVIYKRRYRADEDELDYVKLGYMQELFEKEITPGLVWDFVETPKYQEPDKSKQEGVFFCSLTLIIQILGRIVRKEIGVGVCRAKNTANGLEMAVKGCVTDGKKKILSHFGICNDVYDYGEIEGYTPKKHKANIVEALEMLDQKYHFENKKKAGKAARKWFEGVKSQAEFDMRLAQFIEQLNKRQKSTQKGGDK